MGVFITSKTISDFNAIDLHEMGNCIDRPDLHADISIPATFCQGGKNCLYTFRQTLVSQHF